MLMPEISPHTLSKALPLEHRNTLLGEHRTSFCYRLETDTTSFGAFLTKEEIERHHFFSIGKAETNEFLSASIALYLENSSFHFQFPSAFNSSSFILFLDK
ncbi:hypothetical protein P5673_020001 [Acropora cervicornis]|uniref:Uncharacterized protein n=1 Tax=Acropora cervicornis TaxID=6130 RepID=A0AAD9V1D5_ACRCE|nr:hypothetical protein P5673_020001 [Acropora cervicornis]